MRARLRKLAADIGDLFWGVPALLVAGGVLLAEAALLIDRSGLLGGDEAISRYLYGGGSAGAQALLAVISASAIGVAGTVFSITIAALTLASSQMGPRLLRNFTTDRGNQVTLGVFVGTFAYGLVVLRTLHEGVDAFVPRLALTLSIMLAFLCIGCLIYFVQHVATRINVETVIDLEHEEMRRAIERLTVEEPEPTAPEMGWDAAMVITDARQGYLQQLDTVGLADWAAERQVRLRLLVRPGDFVFPGAPVGLMLGEIEDAADVAAAAFRRVSALGAQRGGAADLEYPVRQLVEVAVRALSPGINDPHTAASVLDRLGAALCTLAGRSLARGVVWRDGQAVLDVPMTRYRGLCDLMFNMIRQNGRGTPAVLIRMIEVMTAVAAVEREPERLAVLAHHGALVLTDGLAAFGNGGDEVALRARHAELARMLKDGPAAAVLAGTRG